MRWWCCRRVGVHACTRWSTMLIMVTVIVVEPNNHNKNFMMIQQRKKKKKKVLKRVCAGVRYRQVNYESAFDNNRSLPDRMRSGPFSYPSVGVRKYQKYSTTDAYVVRWRSRNGTTIEIVLIFDSTQSTLDPGVIRTHDNRHAHSVCCFTSYPFTRWVVVLPWYDRPSEDRTIQSKRGFLARGGGHGTFVPATTYHQATNLYKYPLGSSTMAGTKA